MSMNQIRQGDIVLVMNSSKRETYRAKVVEINRPLRMAWLDTNEIYSIDTNEGLDIEVSAITRYYFIEYSKQAYEFFNKKGMVKDVSEADIMHIRVEDGGDTALFNLGIELATNNIIETNAK